MYANFIIIVIIISEENREHDFHTDVCRNAVPASQRWHFRFFMKTVHLNMCSTTAGLSGQTFKGQKCIMWQNAEFLSVTASGTSIYHIAEEHR